MRLTKKKLFDLIEEVMIKETDLGQIAFAPNRRSIASKYLKSPKLGVKDVEKNTDLENGILNAILMWIGYKNPKGLNHYKKQIGQVLSSGEYSDVFRLYEGHAYRGMALKLSELFSMTGIDKLPEASSIMKNPVDWLRGQTHLKHEFEYVPRDKKRQFESWARTYKMASHFSGVGELGMEKDTKSKGFTKEDPMVNVILRSAEDKQNLFFDFSPFHTDLFGNFQYKKFPQFDLDFLFKKLKEFSGKGEVLALSPSVKCDVIVFPHRMAKTADKKHSGKYPIAYPKEE